MKVVSTAFQKPVILIAAAAVGGTSLRICIDIWLHFQGYFYGIPWDTFSRTLISYMWSQGPFFSQSDGYWLPLQFWLVGSVFKIISPVYSLCNVMVPVVVNHIFFLGSLAVICGFVYQTTQKTWAVVLTGLFGSIFAGDIFVTFTGLCEPMLIFFMLAASFGFYQQVLSGHIENKLILYLTSLFVGLATSTHYIGWFLCVFYCLFLAYHLIRGIRQKDFQRSLWIVGAILLCVIMPLAWLINSYLLFGDPFYPTHLAKQAQASYIGEMSVIYRLLSIPKTVLKEFYPIIIPGAVSFLYLLVKRHKSLLITLPMGFVLAMIWISTAMAFSAPYQEPRYLVFIGWILIPLITIGIVDFFQQAKIVNAVWIGLILAGVITLNLRQVTHFQNSFGEIFIEIGNQTNQLFSANPNSKILLEYENFAEYNVIPVVSGYPFRFILRPKSDELIDPGELFEKNPDAVLAIMLGDDYAETAAEQGYQVQKIGEYTLIFPDS